MSASAWSTEARKTASNSCRLDAPTLRRRLNQLRASKTIRNIKVRVGFRYRCPEIFRQSTKVPEQASNFEALPAQKAYELWLIPTSGAPIPAGVFKPDARGSATVINPPLPAGVEAKAFAITVEPESGSTSPTMPIVMIGAGE